MEARVLDRPALERALAPDAVHERDLGVGEGDGQHEPREARTRAEVGDPPGGSYRLEVHGIERAHHMRADDLVGLDDGRRRISVPGDAGDDGDELRDGGVGQPALADDRLDAPHDLRGEGHGRQATSRERST